MDIKVPNQAAGSSDYGLTQAKTAPGRTQSEVLQRKAADKGQAAGESPAKRAGQQTGQQENGKTVFAVDANNKVVIQMLDSKGKVLQQFPPEEFGAVARELEALKKNLFSREA